VIVGPFPSTFTEEWRAAQVLIFDFDFHNLPSTISSVSQPHDLLSHNLSLSHDLPHMCYFETLVDLFIEIWVDRWIMINFKMWVVIILHKRKKMISKLIGWFVGWMVG